MQNEEAPMRSDKRPPTVTMADVAERAGVSRALVSIVFRDVPGASAATRERVMLAAEALGYRPDPRARLLGSNRSRTVGVTFGLHHEFHAEVVEGLYGAVEGSGYDLALGAVAPTRDERRAVQSLLDYRCEALVLLGPTLPRALLEELAERLPVVVVARALRSRTVDVVRSDDVDRCPARRRAPHRPRPRTHRARRTASVPRAPRSAAAGTATPCVPPGWSPRSVWCQGDSPRSDGERGRVPPARRPRRRPR